jgi:hypothetical protein
MIHRSHTRRRELRRFPWGPLIFGIGLLGSILQWVTGDMQTAIAITAGITICSYPTVRYLHDRPTSIPLMPVVCAIYASYFILPAITGDSTYPRFAGLQHSYYVNTVILSDIGIALMLLTYYWGLRLIAPPTKPIFRAPMPDKQLTGVVIWIGSIALLLAVLDTATNTLGSLASILGFITQLPILMVAYLFYLQLLGRLSRRNSLLLWFIIMPIWLAVDIGSSLIYPAFRDAFLLTMIYLYVRKKLPWRAALPALLIAFILLGTKAQFRSQLASQGGYTNRISSGLAYVQLAAQTSSSLLTFDGVNVVLQSTVQRLDNRGLFSEVMYRTPNTVPYWYGVSYVDSLFKFVPRIVWPGKPAEDMGQAFAHRYGIIDPNDATTSWNLPWMVEFYVNFGIIGVIVGMLLIGLAFAGLQRLMEPAAPDIWSLVCAVFIYSGLFRVDSNFSLVFGGALYSFVLLWLLSTFLSWRAAGDSRFDVYRRFIGERRHRSVPGSLASAASRVRRGIPR